MTYWLRGQRSAVLVFLLIAGLVIGGLGWVTVGSLRIEHEQLAAQVQRDREKQQAERARELDNQLRLALSQLDARVLPVLVQEENRPYNHYSAVFASPFALVDREAAWQPETVLEPSPLISIELPDWMLLHFQTDEACQWGSPQLLSSSLEARLQQLGVEKSPSLLAQQQARQQLLEQLRAHLSPRDLLDRLRERSRSLEWHENTMVLSSNASKDNLAQPPSNPVPPLEQQQMGNKGQNLEAGDYRTRQGTGQRAQNDSKIPSQKADVNVVTGNIPHNGEDWFNRKRSRPGATVTLTRGPMVPLWLTTADGQERLLLARAIHAGSKLICQGVVLDWPRLQAVLREELNGLFPEAQFLPMRELVPLHPERTMAALPIELEPGIVFASIDNEDSPLPELGATPLRVGIGLGWAAALIALLAVGLGGWSLLDLSERRIRFVSAVTHELRTPLTTLRLYLDMLTGGMVREEKQRTEYLDTLTGETERLNRLIANVLAFSRLENQQPSLHPAVAPVVGLLEQVQNTWQRRAQETGKELVIDCALPPGAEVATDLDLVQQVLGNLIDNACKYSRSAEDPRIWLRAHGQAGQLTLQVEDRGPGVPAGDRRAILRPFRRGRAADETVGGVGLGLALVQRWVTMLGGRLSIHEGQGGIGACFRVELPGLSIT